MNKSKAQKSLDRLFNYCEEIDNHLPVNEKAHYIMLPDVLELQRFINNTVEVIHCKDCKWYHQSAEFGTWCQYWDDNTSDCFGYVDDNDFCSKAERRESE